MLKKVWRYVIEDRGDGGIVYARTKKNAEKKLHKAYGSNEILVWRMTNDDFFDKKNKYVWECY